MRNIDLIATYWTIAGSACPHSEQEFSPFDFADRVKAASKAGFAGFGIKEVDLAHTLERRTPLAEGNETDSERQRYAAC